jgi:hypothetical protein
VPAFLRWTNAIGTGLADTVGNWQEQTAPNVWTTLMRPLVPGDNLLMDGSVSSASVTGLHGFGGPDSSPDFGLVQVVNGYAGTVSLAADGSGGLSVIMLNLTSGAISQPAAGTELTVLSSFIWTGGTLNSSSNLSTVTLSGATATIAPTSGGTVSLGSNISLENGAVVTQGAGTIDLTNSGLTFDVTSSCSFNVDPGLGLSAVISSTLGTRFRVRAGSTWTLRTGDWSTLGDVRNEGTFTLMGETTARIINNAPDPNDPTSFYSYLQSAGATYLYGSSAIQTAAGVKIAAGILATKYADTERSSTDCSAGITATELSVTGGDIYIGYGSTHVAFGTLSVTGGVNWTGGTYHPCVRSYAETLLGESDRWEASDRFEIANNATITPIVIDAEGAVVEQAESGKVYVIIKADAPSDPPTEGAPSYDSNLWNLIQIAPLNDNTKVVQYNLQSK